MMRKTVLKVDLDIHPSRQWWKEWIRTVLYVCEHRFHGHVERIQIAPSKTKGFHALIFLDRWYQPLTQVLMQWLCLDDSERASGNLERVRIGERYWNRLEPLPYVRYRTIYKPKKMKEK